jgi:hypothetical protein
MNEVELKKIKLVDVSLFYYCMDVYDTVVIIIGCIFIGWGGGEN